MGSSKAASFMALMQTLCLWVSETHVGGNRKQAPGMGSLSLSCDPGLECGQDLGNWPGSDRNKCLESLAVFSLIFLCKGFRPPV